MPAPAPAPVADDEIDFMCEAAYAGSPNDHYSERDAPLSKPIPTEVVPGAERPGHTFALCGSVRAAGREPRTTLSSAGG